MVVAGQPKTTAEYIQASSRVGRQHPGLVLTCFNVAKPRDRSHYERFVAYHQSFYRFVEATSLTPFSGPALDRALAGTLVGMARHSDPDLNPPDGAMAIEEHHRIGKEVVEEIAQRAGRHLARQDDGEHARLVEKVRDRGMNLLEAWRRLVTQARSEAAAQRSYSAFDRSKTGKPLLYTVTDENQPEENTDEVKFAAPTSMRDVEETSHLWVRHTVLGGKD
jgi:hypothetical protein